MRDTFAIVNTIHPLVNKLLFLCLVQGIARGEKPGTRLGIDTLFGLLFEPLELCLGK